MKKMRLIIIFSLLTPLFITSCSSKKKVYKGDVSLLTYDTMTVEYSLPIITDYDPNLLDIESADKTLFTVKEELPEKNKVVIESNNENKVGIANLTFTYNHTLLDYTKSVAVNYPQKLDEAMDAFTLANMKLPANQEFSVTFNFNNSKNRSAFDESLEIYGRRGMIDYRSYHTGTAKVNTFKVETDQEFAFLDEEIDPASDDYETNITSFNYVSRDTYPHSNTDYYIDSVEKTLDVENSEELFWSVEHGYRPNFSARNDDLNDIYDDAKGICSLIDPNWSALQKYRELYDYLLSTTHYDYRENLKIGYWFYHKSYFLEGVFLNDGAAVCDGFSKTYALLCGILGLPCFRSYGFIKGDTIGHAWNYVQLNNAWYLVCPTWGKNGFSSLDEDIEIRKVANFFNCKRVSLTCYDAFLASKNYFKSRDANYSDLAFPSIKRSDKPYTGNIEDGINYYVSSDQDAETIGSYFNDRFPIEEDKLYLYFECSLHDANQIENWVNIILGTNNAKYNPKPISIVGENCVYTFICLNKTN